MVSSAVSKFRWIAGDEKEVKDGDQKIIRLGALMPVFDVCSVSLGEKNVL